MAANASVQGTRDTEWLRAQVAMMLAEAERVDAAEDASHEHNDRGDREPPNLANRRGTRRTLQAKRSWLDRDQEASCLVS